MRAAVVGHVEWVEFAGSSGAASRARSSTRASSGRSPAGAGVAAVQLAKLAGGATFFTALGDDEVGHRAERELERARPRGSRPSSGRSPSAAASSTSTATASARSR